MKTVTATPTELRSNIYNLLDEILNTGIPIEIDKGSRKLRIIPIEIDKGSRKLRIIPIKKTNKLQNLISRLEAIKGSSDDLADISWEKEVNIDLP